MAPIKPDSASLGPVVDNIRRSFRQGDSSTAASSSKPSYQRLPSIEGTPPAQPSNTQDSDNTIRPGSFQEETTKALGLGISANDKSPDDGVSQGDLSEYRSLSQTPHSGEDNKPSDDHGPGISRQPSQLSAYTLPDRSETGTITPPPEPRHSGGIDCPSRRKIIQKRTSWLSVTILALAFYSTAFSGIYLVVACIKPRFGTKIGGDGLAPSTASLLSALFAKTIELSFVTVFVAFLGQVLSRKALAKNTTGITIADMSMRTWIMQPGTMITHWENVKNAALSILGMIALTTTIASMLYTTAAEALVSPKLKLGDVEHMDLHAQVATSFGNVSYIFNSCQSPITPEMDELWNSTCMQIAYVGPAYSGYEKYLTEWASIAKNGASSDERPVPGGTWFDNTTVTGSWIEAHNVTELSKKFGRMVTNVTAAMPHTNVFASARFPKNAIRQPEDFDDQGEFHIEASVPSPAVNVICAGMTADELDPLVYTRWPDKSKFDPSKWNNDRPEDIPVYPSWLNKTVVDEIFDFGEKRGQRHPVFPKLPIEYNTILNGSGLFTADSIYLLGKPPPYIKDPPYVLCAIKGGITPNCSTRYQAAASGGRLTAHCNDPNDKLAYSRRASDTPSFVVSRDWKNSADEWSKSIGLNTGVTDGQGSNARLLMEFTTYKDRETNTTTLNPKLPTMAEALSVMAAPVLLKSTQEVAFDHNTVFKNDTEPSIEKFKASLRLSDYVSGGSEPWQGAFYVILALIFLTNLICLAYLYIDFRGVQLTDFTEPQNTMALALNSPSSIKLRGACGGGPEGPQLTQRWVIAMDEQDEHYYMISKEESRENAYRKAGAYDNRYDAGDGIPLKAPPSPRVEEYRRLSHAHSSISILAT